MQRKRKRTVIGLILEEMEAEFSQDLIRSIQNAVPANKDIRLIVLAGKYINRFGHDKHHEYKLVYNSIFRLGEICEIDGLIIHLGSMSDERMDAIKSLYSGNFESVPKVFIAMNSKEFTTVNYDNESGINEAVNCLVNVNGLTKFCMLGGRDDNADARARKEIFMQCLKDYGISFSRWNYEKTNMSDDCVEAALRLLDNNIGVQAVFCVNDAVAKGLYEAMRLRGLTPGKDILVFGFDNTHMAGEMIPTLSSVGADTSSLGQKALEVLLSKLSGSPASSVLVSTRLYGRESFDYEMYDFTPMEFQKADETFLYRIFDECFYRYRSEVTDRQAVDLKRLFFEIMSGIFSAAKKRYMSFEDFNRLSRLIEIFFAEGAMEYTDASKMIKSIRRLQIAFNTSQYSPAVKMIINKLFAKMREEAVAALSEKKSRERVSILKSRRMMQEFMISNMEISALHKPKEYALLQSIRNLGMRNAALYLYRTPFSFDVNKHAPFPDDIRLMCVMRSGELYIIPPERQDCSITDIFIRDELSFKCKGYAAFTIFFNDKVYGILLCELSGDVYESGEYLALQLGRAVFLNELLDNEHK